jgi:hypothetical protein
MHGYAHSVVSFIPVKIVDLFERPLRQGKQLKAFTRSTSFGIETKMGDVEQRSSRTQLGFLGHLIERGLGGGQAYMAAGGNHRAISQKHWVSQEKTKPCNLIDSCVSIPDDSCKFDVGSKIAVYVHGLSTDTESSSVVLKSPCAVDGVDPANKVNNYNLFSVASKRRVTPLNGKFFKRLLLFFGYSSDIADDAFVDFDSIIGFFIYSGATNSGQCLDSVRSTMHSRWRTFLRMITTTCVSRKFTGSLGSCFGVWCQCGCWCTMGNTAFC